MSVFIVPQYCVAIVGTIAIIVFCYAHFFVKGDWYCDTPNFIFGMIVGICLVTMGIVPYIEIPQLMVVP